MSTLIVAFQVRPPEIVAGSVAGALAALIGDDEYRWNYESLARRVTLQEWRGTVERVTRIRFNIRRPNPHYQDAEDLERLIELAQAEVGRLELQAAQGGGLDLGAPFVAQTIGHVEANYGDARITGVATDGTESVYSTDMRSVEVITEARVSPTTGEVGQASLAEAVAEAVQNHETE